MTTKIDHDDIERKARAATPGEWRYSSLDGAILSGAGPDATHVGYIDLLAANEAHVLATSPQVVLALIAQIRSLRVFVAAIPDAALHIDKAYRDDFPELFTDDDGNALYMDELKRRILERGTVLP